MARKPKRKRRQFSTEFKAEAVRLAREGRKTLAEVANDLDITTSSLWSWVKQAEVDEVADPQGALTTEEREELRQLRKENKRLRMERDILKKATALFAQEN